MLYEAVLLFGVVFVTDWLLDTLTQSRHALTLRHARQALLFFVLGAYFVFFWTHGGQTLAMKTWRVRLIFPGNPQVPLTKAVLRYLLAWMWFMPALIIDYAFDLKGWVGVATIPTGMAVWALTALFTKDRQFLHDQLVGTRLVGHSVPAAKPKSA
jgi:uncharacterized RDD family membrane protein YckC